MEIEVICTGDEVLTGKIVNSNFSYIAQKLEDYGFSVKRGVTVGDDRDELLAAFRRAGERADTVIVNGGLGPTVDDLSQEVAAQAAGVGLVLHEDWLHRMERFFIQRGRTMPENNKKQAMLPQGAEMLDNPIGTACGFAVHIGRAMFYFTPGVPRELFRMLEEQILPRLLSESPNPGVIFMRRFHSFGLGESHVDQLLSGLEAMDQDGAIKLGFRAHYPQLETKLVCRAANEGQARAKLAPVADEIYRRIGNFILTEDDDTHESVVQKLLLERGESVSLMEDLTGGLIAQRLSVLPGAEKVFVRGVVGLNPRNMVEGLGLEPSDFDGDGAAPGELARMLAQAMRLASGSSYGLAVIGRLDGPPRGRARHMTSALYFALAGENGVITREASLTGNREWLGLGAAEMGLDLLRRHLKGLPVDEKIDFEKRAEKPAERAG